MGPLLEELQERFQCYQHPCLLYLASEVIKIFGSDQSCAEYLGTLITTLLGKTVSLLQSIEDFTLRPDLADDCFLFSSRCVRYCPHLLVPSTIFPSLLDCAMTGITVQHREACRSVLTFLEEVFELTRAAGGKPYQTTVDITVLPRGSALTRVLIAALAGALPESRLDEVIHTFLSFAHLYGSKVVQWAQEAASLIPTAVVTEAEKLNFLQALSSAASGAESPTVTSSMEELSDVCRRNKKVIEVVQSALQPLRLTLASPS
ncbi:hypothetical protein O6H91_19G030900 [Diphasiastrum complanatum]|uniref:Uncharacterized protein n=1 Tax=Diphasiastrum complanatum TaxID=34168 RepID=A0ACC2ATY6_DIPCM|nr:hypothetical protein O6H91_19G030900 [Diphasiastrum complanatum]